MDVDVCAGGDSTRRKMDTMGDGALEVVPLELYDSSRAKIDANLRWLFAKAYGIGKNTTLLRYMFLLISVYMVYNVA